VDRGGRKRGRAGSCLSKPVVKDVGVDRAVLSASIPHKPLTEKQVNKIGDMWIIYYGYVCSALAGLKEEDAGLLCDITNFISEHKTKFTKYEIEYVTSRIAKLFTTKDKWFVLKDKKNG